MNRGVEELEVIINTALANIIEDQQSIRLLRHIENTWFRNWSRDLSIPE